MLGLGPRSSGLDALLLSIILLILSDFHFLSSSLDDDLLTINSRVAKQRVSEILFGFYDRNLDLHIIIKKKAKQERKKKVSMR